MSASDSVFLAFDKFSHLFFDILSQVCLIPKEESQVLAEQATFRVLANVVKKLHNQPNLRVEDILQAKNIFLDLTTTLDQNQIVGTVNKEVQTFVEDWAREYLPLLNPIQRVQLADVLEKNMNDFGI